MILQIHTPLSDNVLFDASCILCGLVSPGKKYSLFGLDDRLIGPQKPKK